MMHPSWFRSALLCLLPLMLLVAFGPYAEAASEQSNQPEDISVAVFPFSVHAAPGQKRLGSDLARSLRRGLDKHGFDVLDLGQQSPETRLPPVDKRRDEDIRQAGRSAGADYAVHGSVTVIGETLSLDARLIPVIEPSIVHTLFATGQGQGRIGAAAMDLADRIRATLLRDKIIASLSIRGNKIMGDDFVRSRLSLQEGDIFDPALLNQDIKALFKTGYFKDVQVQIEDSPKGQNMLVQVEEKPIIKDIEISGAEEIDRKDILESMRTKPGSVLNSKVISKDLATIREMYRKDGFYKAEVNFQEQRVAENEAKLILTIDEGQKFYIEDIVIKGAQQLDPDELKDQLALSERGLFSWITGGGVLNEGYLDRDAAALEAYYANRGFIDVQVAQPEVSVQEEGISVTFKVNEGPRYAVGEVSLDGELIAEEEVLHKQIRLDDLSREQEPFDRSVLSEDRQALSEYYAEFGYAFAEAETQLDKNAEAQTIDVRYSMSKNQKVFIRRVEIVGNEKTRDNVIRRELKLTDGDLFQSDELARSKQSLRRLDYFESVDIETVPTGRPDRMDLKVDVKDKSTGSFSIGAGFSSVDGVFVTGQIQERNLFGRGYTLGFKGNLGRKSSLFQFSFWNPHLFDSRFGAGLDAYNTDNEYNDYDLQKIGGKAKFAFSIGDYTRLFWDYKFEQYTLDDIDENASDEIKRLGTDANLASALSLSVRRDTTDRRLIPTKGSKNTLRAEYSGGFLGGDDDFIKTSYEFSWFKTLFWKVVFGWHWKAGWLFENTGDPVPDFERYYLGGINTVRGYDYQDISALDDEGDEIGGHKTFYTNLEIVFPLKEDMGFWGLLFFDAGDVWGEDESPEADLYKSVGAGIRWNSPLGHIRLEYGYPLDDLKENDGQFEFSVGQFF